MLFDQHGGVAPRSRECVHEAIHLRLTHADLVRYEGLTADDVDEFRKRIVRRDSFDLSALRTGS